MQRQSTKIPQICAICGVSFLVFPCQVREGRLYYCGRACYLATTGRTSQQFADRFWAKVRPSSECWEWTGATNDQGYGLFNTASPRKGKRHRERAHRVAYELHNGVAPNDLEVCHSCDNPPCCNPAHLFMGTRLDNALDAAEKGRTTLGERNTQSKVTEERVREIRRLRAETFLYLREIGAMYGISESTVWAIAAGLLWRHIK